MEFVKFNILVTLSQLYNVLSYVFKRMSRLYGSIKNLDMNLILMGAMTVLSIVTLSVVIKTQTREATMHLREVDLTAALSLKDFFTYRGWLKLARRWGVVKTVSIYFVITFVGVAGALYILSMYGIGTIESAIGNAILASLLISITFYRIISKA